MCSSVNKHQNDKGFEWIGVIKPHYLELYSFALILFNTPFSSKGVCVCVYVLCSLIALNICVVL